MNRYILHYARRYLGRTALASLAAASILAGCASEDERAACSWLFAPPSFVDAGQPGCTAEPSGQRCDPATGRCEEVCQPGEYLLTCITAEASRLAIPEESVKDPVVSRDRAVRCNPLETPGKGSTGTAYCCQCGQ